MVVRNAERLSFFFLGLDASEDGYLVFQHPHLRTVRRPVEALGGSAREIPDLHPKPRRDLALSVDYRPARPHPVARIEVLSCGLRKEVPLGLRGCDPVDRDLDLVPGFHEYVLLRVRVEDASTGDPIPGAAVSHKAPPDVLRFDWGDLSLGTHPGQEAVSLHTGSDGVARLRFPDDAPPWITVTREGYRRYDGNVGQALEAGDEEPEVVVALQPDAAELAGVQVSLRGGGPLPGAFLLVFDEEGAPRFDCSRGADTAGRVRFPEGCLDGADAVLFHPRARLARIPGSDLALRTEIEVAPAPPRPLRVRLVDRDGEPLAVTPIALRVGDLILDANALAAAGSRSGASIPFLTGADGEVSLRGADPDGPEALALVLGTGDRREEIDLQPFEAGEEVVLTVGPRR